MEQEKQEKTKKSTWWTPENKARLREKYKGRMSKAGEILLSDNRPQYLIIVDEKAVLRQD